MSHSVKKLLETARFQVVEHSVTRPDGKVATCQSVQHPGAVVILPLFEDGRVCLIRNVRLTVGKKLIELPAGTREPGEPPAETALRELQEETGFRAARIEPMAVFYSSPGFTNEELWAFRATGLTPGPPSLEENEQIENLILAWSEAMAMVDRGEIRDGKTLVALLSEDRRRNAGG